MEYTIHDLGEKLDAAIMERAQVEHKTVDVVLKEAIERGLQTTPSLQPRRDLSDVAGQCTIDADSLAIFQDQRRIDPEMWR
ncbi:hypothetical protein [Aeoliella sp. SH292]|uniref:hypothetical protein n=1 Tax=Aeoliella sp. SH292 TaxID=3454464 RepID=UPI003F9AEF8C